MLRLDLDLLLRTLFLLAGLGLGLGTHDATTPVPLGLLGLLHVALLDGLDELAELGLVLAADLSDGEGSGGLKQECQCLIPGPSVHDQHTFL